MSSWFFFGRVLPERIPLRIGLPEPMRWSSELVDLRVKYNAEFRCADGQIVARATVTEGNVDVLTLRNQVELGIRPIIDAIGYQHGVGFDVEIISAASVETGEGVVFGIAIPAMAESRDPKAYGTIASDILIAAATEHAAQIALADFSRGNVRVPVWTGFFCYHAIEAIMQSMKSSDSEGEDVAWKRTRDALRIDRPPLEYVKTFADLTRHGRPGSISSDDRARVFKITDETIRRFLQFLVRGKKSLPEQDFPTYLG